MSALRLTLSLAVLLALLGCQGCSGRTPPTQNEAKAVLMRLAVMQERYYLENETYTDELIEIWFPTDPFVTESGDYTLTITTDTHSDDLSASYNYVGTVRYNGDENDADGCLWLRMNSLGSKTSGPSTQCWQR